jgi:hypothetical protein
MKTARHRKAVLFFAAAAALLAVCAGAFAFAHLDHDCCGEDCPVCLKIRAAQNVLEGLGRAALDCRAVLPAFFACLILNRAEACFMPPSPVALKVKLTA